MDIALLNRGWNRTCAEPVTEATSRESSIKPFFILPFLSNPVPQARG